MELDTPTTTRSREKIPMKRLSEEKFMEENDLLNQSLEENVEESCLFSDKDNSQENSPSKPQKLPKVGGIFYLTINFWSKLEPKIDF